MYTCLVDIQAPDQVGRVVSVIVVVVPGEPWVFNKDGNNDGNGSERMTGPRTFGWFDGPGADLMTLDSLGGPPGF